VALKHIKYLVVLSGLIIQQANASPPDMTCTGNHSLSSFEIHLVTDGSGLNSRGIIPLAIHHSKLETGAVIDGGKPLEISLYSEDVKGQWLKDERIDLNFYREMKNSSGVLHSIELIIRTKSIEKYDDESGHLIHVGKYELDVYSGSLREHSEILIHGIKGKAVYSVTRCID
jgi:hypothetical protein